MGCWPSASVSSGWKQPSYFDMSLGIRLLVGLQHDRSTDLLQQLFPSVTAGRSLIGRWSVFSAMRIRVTPKSAVGEKEISHVRAPRARRTPYT